MSQDRCTLAMKGHWCHSGMQVSGQVEGVSHRWKIRCDGILHLQGGRFGGCWMCVSE